MNRTAREHAGTQPHDRAGPQPHDVPRKWDFRAVSASGRRTRSYRGDELGVRRTTAGRVAAFLRRGRVVARGGLACLRACSAAAAMASSSLSVTPAPPAPPLPPASSCITPSISHLPAGGRAPDPIPFWEGGGTRPSPLPVPAPPASDNDVRTRAPSAGVRRCSLVGGVGQVEAAEAVTGTGDTPHLPD